MEWVILALVGLLAFANGSNDNSKGVATLVGFGAAKPLPALIFATIATAIGGGISFFIAGGLLAGFSGGWLFGSGVHIGGGFFAAVLIGACCWVLLASRTGMPVSTTHAIIGALCGAGLVGFGSAQIQWGALGAKFATPLAVSPVLALVIVYLVAWPVMFLVGRIAGRCACVIEEPASVPMLASAGGNAVAPAGPTTHLKLVVGTEAECPPAERAAAITGSAAASGIHWLSCGLISFARGWNDTPKVAALSLVALAGVRHGTAIGFAIVTLATALGGLIAGQKVLETLAKRLTPLPLTESLTASLVTAALVSLASWMALPVSTTQVATGAIVGAGLKTDPKGVKWGKVGKVVLSWVITLPVAAIIAAVAELFLH